MFVSIRERKHISDPIIAVLIMNLFFLCTRSSTSNHDCGEEEEEEEAKQSIMHSTPRGKEKRLFLGKGAFSDMYRVKVNL